MKKVFLLLVLALPFMVACSSDKDKDKDKNKDKNYDVYLDGDNLYMVMPCHEEHGYIKIDAYVPFKEVYELLKKEDRNREISIYARCLFKVTDKYGYTHNLQKEILCYKISIDEVKKYKDFDYFGKQYGHYDFKVEWQRAPTMEMDK